MVEKITESRWRCPHCDEEDFEYETSCMEHIASCVEVAGPDEYDIELYKCSICENTFDNSDDAETCEDEHTQEEKQEIENKTKFREAAMHPNQTRLV